MTASTFPLRVGLSRVFGVLFVVIGVLNLLLAFATDGRPVLLALGAILTLLGILYLVGAALVITPTEAQVKNPLGMTMKRFPITSIADLRMDGRNVIHVPTGKRVIALNGTLDKGDATRLHALLTGGSDEQGVQG